MTRNARYVSIALLGAMLLGAPERAHQAPGGPEVAPPKAMGPQEVEVVAVVMDQATHQPHHQQPLFRRLRIDHGQRVRVEGQHGVRAADHLLVAHVHAVELAHRDVTLAALGIG